MPFVFLGAVAVATAFLLRSGAVQTSAATEGTRFAFGARATLVGLRGWLLVYVLGLAADLAHGLALTVGSVIIYAKPSLAGLHSVIPLWALLFYVVSNLGLLVYGVVLVVLMSQERKAAIVHNILFNALSIAFLVIWFLLSAKSPVGTIVDALPGLAAIAYVSRSRRVRNTFTR